MFRRHARKVTASHVAAGAVVLAFGTACAPDLVEWEDITPLVHGEAEWPSRLLLASDGGSTYVAPPGVQLEPDGACPGSVVFAHSGGDEWYAAWWELREGGSVAVLTARSDDDGRSWQRSIPADTRDRGVRGCTRPPIAIAADSAGGYVHLAYFLEPPGERGVWYSHSMERGVMWHAPVGVMYGADPARASVAAHADTVVVAFEHPNAAEGRIGLAVSRTAGHIIEGRTVASVGSGYASHPRVTVNGRDVLVAWTLRLGPGSGASEHVVVRRGRLRPPPPVPGAAR